jgi:phenylalanyl-tRNA synthetase beta chain
MLCSAKELGLGVDHAGILELQTDAPPGTPFLEAIPIADEQIIIDVSANRPDLLCHRGVARELAVSLGGAVKLPEIGGSADRRIAKPSAHPPIRPSGKVDGVEVRLEDPEGAPRYMIAVIRGVKVQPSPLARRASPGHRPAPVNNIVDATNYILFEVNRPMHAFDLAAAWTGGRRAARRGRGDRHAGQGGAQLTPEMTAICDAERPQIVAGVMGSAESEVTAGTTDIVLEAAYFQPTRIRRTRRALGISSESSYRFERGIDMLGLPDAMARAIDLIIAITGGGGEIREPPLDLWPEPQKPRSVFLRDARVSQLLGVDVPRKETERLLSAVGFVAAPKDDRLAVQIPGWRPDVTREVDLIEEVARLRGYDSFPDELRPYRPGTVPDAPSELTLRRIRDQLIASGSGLLEARTLPLGPADAPDAIEVKNPLSAEEAHLRSRLLPGLIRRVEYNWSMGNRDVRLFEVGTVFRPSGRPAERPSEALHLAIVLTGARHPAHWTGGSGQDAKLPDMDIWD